MNHDATIEPKAKARLFRRLCLILIGIIASLCICFAVIGGGNFILNWFTYEVSSAHYGNATFTADDERMYSSFWFEAKKARDDDNLYLEIYGLRRRIDQLSPEDIQSLTALRRAEYFAPEMNKGMTYDDTFGNYFKFDDAGELIEIHVWFENPKIRFARDIDGPYLSLPTSERDLKSILGEPRKIDRVRGFRPLVVM